MSRLIPLALLGAMLAAPAMADGRALSGGPNMLTPLSASAQCVSETLVTHENGVRITRMSQDPICRLEVESRAAAAAQPAPPQTSVTVNVTVNEDAYGTRRLRRDIPFYERFATRWDR